jgi:hypothetical protein
MAAPADYLDTVDLKAVAAGGLVREDVLDKIFDISEIPTPFLDMARSDTCKNSYTEWTEDELAAPDTDNAVVSGSDASGASAASGARVGNHTQISTKVVSVTERAQNTNQIGRSDELAYNTMRKMQELRRDVEAICLSPQASVADDNNTTPGRSGGLAAWIATNSYHGSGGSAGGFNNSTKVVDAPTAGDGRALTWEMVADAIEAVYTLGGNTTALTSVPALTKRLGRYLFSTPYAAAPTADVNGTTPTNQTSQGYIDMFRTDFGFTMKIVPNRLQQVYDSGDTEPVDVCDVFLIDPEHVGVGYLHSYKVEPLAKLGLSHRRLLSVDWTLKCYLERAHAVIRDIIPTSAVTSGA